jgi:hypothetical protein
VCRAGAAIKSKSITLDSLTHPASDARREYVVPASSMRRWVKMVPSRDGTLAPLWLVERDERRRTSLPNSGGVKGGGTVLGKAAEAKLILEIVEAAKARCPLTRDELEEIVRNLAIELKLKIAKTGQSYTALSDVSTLVTAFLVRAAKRGVYITEKTARKYAVQRLINQNRDSLTRYATKVNPALKAFQRKHGVKLGLKDVGNWDETGLDLCAFASSMSYLFLKFFGNEVAVPFEQSPHMTVVVGFTGESKMVLLLVIKGSESVSPSPSHAQLLGRESLVYIAQTESGWITNALKTAFLKLQIDHGILGQRPMVVNVDGHDSNVNNEELEKLAAENKILLVVPPSHTSAAVGGMGTQQCDRPAHQGGPIALLKAAFRRMLKRQFFGNVRDKTQRSTVSVAEIAAILHKAWHEAFDQRKMEKLNFDVGWYVDDDGDLQWDIGRLLLPEHDEHADGAPAPTAPAAPAEPAALTAPVVSNFGGRAAVQMRQAAQEVAVTRIRAEVNQIFAVHNAVLGISQPVVPRPTEATERGGAARKHSRDGLLIGGPEWLARQAEKKETSAKAAAKKIADALAFWVRHRAAVRAVEQKIEEDKAIEELTVSELKALIISRTGATAKSKGGKAALLTEAASAMSSASATCIPPTPPPQDENDGPVCDCGAVVDVDLELDADGLLWCESCGGRLEE